MPYSRNTSGTTADGQLDALAEIASAVKPDTAATPANRGNFYLAYNGVINAPVGPLAGGSYLLSFKLTTWTSVSLQIQRLGADGATYLNYGSAVTADGMVEMKFAQGDVIKVINAGAGSLAGLFVAAARVPL